MKKYIYLTLIFAALLLYSCSEKPDKDPYCLGDLHPSLYISNYAFMQHYGDSTRDGVHYTTGYSEGSGGIYSFYFTQMEVGDICNEHTPLIEFEVWLHNEDSVAVMTAYIQEEGNPQRTDLTLEHTTGSHFYKSNTSFNFETTTGHTPGSLTLYLKFAFPHQGSQSNDSLYFFSNLEQLKTTISTIHQGG